MAVSQAWLLGGHEGRWPLVEWTARGPEGPRPMGLPRAWAAKPDPTWVALLRHGSGKVAGDRRRKGETELEAMAWKGLLAGDGAPWMALGSVILDLDSRLRWLPLVGAVVPGGALRLPPWLDGLFPPGFCDLPDGWWEVLLGGMDARGRLLPPEGESLDASWTGILAGQGRDLAPLRWEGQKGGVAEVDVTAHAHPWGELGWMVDPRIRAWARGWGACPEALLPLVRGGVAAGVPPGALERAVLGTGGDLDALPDEAWRKAIHRELHEEMVRPEPPAPCGHPMLDRLAVRWGGSPPPSQAGYPEWKTRWHPCADPFHWLAAGRIACLDGDMEGSLAAFAQAHAHFHALRAPTWASRAATNASLVARAWGDLPAAGGWGALAGKPPEPVATFDALFVEACRGEYEVALAGFRQLLIRHPEFSPAWVQILCLALNLERRDLVAEALPHMPPGPERVMGEAYLAEAFDPIDGLEADQEAIWAVMAMRRGRRRPDEVWELREACSHQILSLEVGLEVLEADPGSRTGQRLVELQSIADRTGAEKHLARVKALWPGDGEATPPDAEAVILRWLACQAGPTWIVMASSDRVLGEGEPLPGVLGRVREAGSLAPTQVEDWIWWAVPLAWKGVRCGAVLLRLEPGARLVPPADLCILAPWVATLVPPTLPERVGTEGAFLTDGSEPIRSLMEEIARVAPTHLPVLVLGPTGSGKELLAQEVHRRSGRTGRLVPVNCSAFAEGVLESELFGHVKGAFTGADRDRVGAIEHAEGGTLFLDEVADLSPRLQSLFLRVLQEKEVRRVGSERSHRVDVRFVAATHKPLPDLVAAGVFRHDLLYRLQGCVLQIPSLAERRHEFPYLLPRLVQRLAKELGRPVPVLVPGLAEALARLPWPGNMRQLRHALERAILRAGEEPLGPDHLPELAEPDVFKGTWAEANRDFQRRMLQDAMRRHRFQATHAASALGISRASLYALAQRTGLDLVAERKAWEAGGA